MWSENLGNRKSCFSHWYLCQSYYEETDYALTRCYGNSVSECQSCRKHRNISFISNGSKCNFCFGCFKKKYDEATQEIVSFVKEKAHSECFSLASFFCVICFWYQFVWFFGKCNLQNFRDLKKINYWVQISSMQTCQI